MQHANDFDPVLDRPVENEDVVESLDWPETQVLKLWVMHGVTRAHLGQ